MGWEDSTSVLVVGGLAAGFAILFSLWHVYQHLMHYTEPVFQRYIIRIIFTVPVYAVTSLCSLLDSENAVYYTTVRDVYEAWVIYNFMSLMLAYLGGPGEVLSHVNGKVIEPSWWHGTCCFPPMHVNAAYLRRCKQGTIQFVYVKPILAAVTIILQANGKFGEGEFNTDQGYLYITIMYNICYTVALFALLMFYLATREMLEPHKPLLKFIIVKTIIFLTYWQGFLFQILYSSGAISSVNEAVVLQNFIICLQMAVAAPVMLYAFPFEEYKSGLAGSKVMHRLGHAVSITDVVNDTVHQFAPTYHNYVLHSDGTTSQPRPVQNSKGMLGDKMESKANLLSSMQTSEVHDEDAVGIQMVDSRQYQEGRHGYVGRQQHWARQEYPVAGGPAGIGPPGYEDVQLSEHQDQPHEEHNSTQDGSR